MDWKIRPAASQLAISQTHPAGMATQTLVNGSAVENVDGPALRYLRRKSRGAMAAFFSDSRPAWSNKSEV